MRPARTHDVLTLVALGAGVLVPFVYYGVQIVGAACNPGYSFVHQVASELGSSRAVHPVVFNGGIMVQGVLTLIASAGFLRVTLRLGVRPTLAVLLFLALVVNGVQMIWAGWFPLPDPRHAGQPLFMIAMFLLPILLTTVVWGGSSASLRLYLVATMILLATMTLISSRMIVDASQVRGLTQRLYTFAVFPVVAVSALALARRYDRRVV